MVMMDILRQKMMVMIDILRQGDDGNDGHVDDNGGNDGQR